MNSDELVPLSDTLAHVGASITELVERAEQKYIRMALAEIESELRKVHMMLICVLYKLVDLELP